MLQEELQHGHSGLGGDGKKIRYMNLEGAPAIFQGTTSLAGGVATVQHRSINKNSLVFLKVQTPLGTPGTLYENSASRVVGTSFTINSTSGTDTSIINWVFINL